MKLFNINSLFIISSLLTSFSTSYVININRSKDLEWYLCKSKLPADNDITLILSTNITHLIKSSSFCLIDTKYSLTITSSDSSTLATIKCVNGSSRTTQPNGGFAFINLHNLTLQRLLFIDCGAYLAGLNKNILEKINSTSSPVYFIQHQSAVLLFVHNKAVLVSEVQIETYFGFGIATVNPINMILNGTQVTHSRTVEFYQKSKKIIGCGVLLLFIDNAEPPVQVSIVQTSIIFNFDFVSKIYCLSRLKSTKGRIPVMNSAGLTILYAQKKYSINVSVSQSTFYGNFGSFSGGLFILHYNNIPLSNTFINGTTFRRNYNQNNCHGGGLSLYIFQDQTDHFNNGVTFMPLSITNSRFTEHTGLFGKADVGAIYIGINSKFSNTVTVSISNSCFTRNSVNTTGSCIFATTIDSEMGGYEIGKRLQIIMTNITALNNAPLDTMTPIAKAGMFTFVNIKSVNVTGSNNSFCHNFGSVFEVINTAIFLSGTMYFNENTGEKGSAIKLHGNSVLYFENGLRGTFFGNTALTKGGAIYIYDESYTVIKYCKFQSSVTSDNISQLNISLLFINNTAGESGNSIFSTSIYNCYVNDYYFNISQASNYYSKIFNFVSSSSLNHLSTVPERRCICDHDQCTNIHYVYTLYSGQTLHIPMAAMSINNEKSYSVIKIGVANDSRSSGNLPISSLPSLQVSSNSVNQILQESKMCTLVNVTVFNYNTQDNMKAIRPLLIVSSLYDSSVLKVKLNLLECPFGFQLNKLTAQCECSQIINRFSVLSGYEIVCQIHSDNTAHNNPLVTLTRPIHAPLIWFGLVKTNNGSTNNSFGIALTYAKYATTKPQFTSYVINGTSISITNPSNYTADFSPLCLRNREGPLCSTCAVVNGVKYSVVFGSIECQYCSNWWLLTLVLYALAGPLLIYLLFSLRLTLTTGTITGITFFAQTFAIISDTHSTSEEHKILSVLYKITSTLIQLINLSLGFPLCFYNGMTELWKAGLNLVFPVYLLMIVLILIILCRYSVWLSNKISHSSVQVLVTIVHLSFSRLLTTTMDVFAPINIYLNTTDIPLKVWYSDATIEYGKHGHLILMVITAFIVGPILITYLTILVAGRPLQKIHPKIREYIRPIYEAIHAPYQQNKEFFFVVSVLLLSLLYVLDTVYTTEDVSRGYAVAIPVCCIFIAVESFSRPYKRNWLNAFNVFLLCLSIVIVGTLWYFYLIGYKLGVTMVLTVTGSIVALTTIAVIIGHLLWVTGGLTKIQLKLCKLHSWYANNNFMNHHQEHRLHLYDNEITGSVIFERCDELREPLLEYTDSSD